MDLKQLSDRAMEIRQQYSTLEKELYGRIWTREEIALGFMGDVGDLMKLVLAESGVRAIDDSKAKLAHELSDCLWSVLILAHLYEVDIEQSFMETMSVIEQHIANHPSQTSLMRLKHDPKISPD